MNLPDLAKGFGRTTKFSRHGVSGLHGLSQLERSDHAPSEGEGEGEGCGGGSSGAGGTPTPQQLDIDIWRGGYQTQSSGAPIAIPSGIPVSEQEEDSLGSFTLVNYNDTDADGQLDFIDTNGVIATPNIGTDEVDLMKIRIEKPNDYDICGGNVVVMGGGTRIWTTSQKTQLAPGKAGISGVVLDDDDWAGKSSIILWAEAVWPSDNQADITMSVSYRDYPTDTLKATAIWTQISPSGIETGSQTYAGDTPAGVIRTSYADLIADDQWDAIPISGANTFLQTYDGTGLLPDGAGPPNGGLFNSIAFQFNIIPKTLNAPGVHFDVARRVEAEVLLNGSVVTSQNEDFPTIRDLPNDDINEENEDSQPIWTNFRGQNWLVMHSTDQPGINFLGGQPAGTEKTHNNNFEEYMRVNVNYMDPAGNVLAGSRASGFAEWSSCVTGVYNFGWARKTPLDADENQIDTGHSCPIQH